MRARTAAGAIHARSSVGLRAEQYVQFWLQRRFVTMAALREG